MPTLTFTISVATGNELTDCFGVNYQATIDGQPNPETKTQFALKQIAALLKQHVILYRKRQRANNTAGDSEPAIT